MLHLTIAYQTSNIGGKLDWINENHLMKNIKNKFS